MQRIATDCYKLLRSDTDCYGVLRNATECYGLLMSATDCCRVLTHLWWTRDRSQVNWEEFVRCQVRAYETYSDAKRQLRDRNRAVLMNAQSSRKWWFTLLSLGCSARVRHCLRSLIRVVDWCVILLVRLICCRIILTATSPGRLLIGSSLAIRLLVLPPLPSGRERSGVSC